MGNETTRLDLPRFRPTPAKALAPLNDTHLSGKPYYCGLCGLGFAEHMACESAVCHLENEATARARLVEAHLQGKGMPEP